MENKIKKHEELERARWEYLKKREIEFDKKREKIEKMHKDREIEEIKNVEVSLKRYHEKL